LTSLITPQPCIAKGRKTGPALLCRTTLNPRFSVTNPFVLANFTAIVSEPRFAVAAGIALLAGLVRGFTGFGSALIYVPLMSAVYGPRIAVPTILLIDTICTLPWTIKARRDADWRELWPVALASVLTIPLGVMLLVYVDALMLRWFICALVAVALAALISGWRYHGRPTLPASLATGAASGIGGGSVQIAAPPLLLFWLGGQSRAVTIRANIMMCLQIGGLFSLVSYSVSGVLTADVLSLSILLGVPFLFAIGFGAQGFHRTTDTHYRRIAYIIIAIAALVSLPLFDSLR
jgi:hypothetical protein